MALKIGAENKPKLYAAAGLGSLVLIIAIFQLPKFFGGSPAPTPVVTAPTPPPAVTRVRTNTPSATTFAHEAVKLPSGSELDPTLHPEVMAQAEGTAYTGNGRNIFSANSVAAAPVHIEKAQAFRPSAPVVPQGPPPPPNIELKFYGYASNLGAKRQVFLLHGDDIFLAHEGDVVDRRYRVVAIRPMSVEVEDIPYHNTQSLPLTQN